MIGLLINPTDRTITQVEVRDAACIGDVCGWRWFDIVPLIAHLDMFVDDEGLLSYPNPQGYFSIGRHVFAGRALVLSRRDTPEGPDCASVEDLVVVADWLAGIVGWLDTPPAADVEPRIEFYPIDPNAEGD